MRQEMTTMGLVDDAVDERIQERLGEFAFVEESRVEEMIGSALEHHQENWSHPEQGYGFDGEQAAEWVKSQLTAFSARRNDMCDLGRAVWDGVATGTYGILETWKQERVVEGHPFAGLLTDMLEHELRPWLQELIRESVLELLMAPRAVTNGAAPALAPVAAI